MIVEWEAPFANYEAILEYDVIFLTHDGTYVNDEVNCHGQDPSLTACSIEMSDMRQLTMLGRGELIVARVKARNVNGWHAYSQQNVEGAVIETEPHAIAEVSFSLTESTNDQIVLLWTMPANGGSDILGFEIKQSVKDSNTWSTVTVDASLVTYTLSESISAGTTYLITVSSFNKYGSSADSSALQVTTGQAPEQVAAPLLNTEDQLYVVVTWTQPFENYAQILGYQVFV